MAILDVRIHCSVCNSVLDGEMDPTGVLKIDPCESCLASAREGCAFCPVADDAVAEACANCDLKKAAEKAGRKR